MKAHPSYKESSFLGMVQHELIRSESIDTDIADLDLETKLLDDFEEKLNTNS